MIVVAILGLVGVITIPSITSTFRFSVQSSAREIATLIKDASNSAQITGKVHRIAYDLKSDQYWVESSSEQTFLKSDESREKEKEQHSFFSGEPSEEEKKKNGGFRQDSLLTRKKRTLPIGVHFKNIFTEQTPEPITTGIAYTHIFPQGMSEKTLVHLEDTSKNEVSLVVTNILGRCQVQGREIDPKEVFTHK